MQRIPMGIAAMGGMGAAGAAMPMAGKTPLPISPHHSTYPHAYHCSATLFSCLGQKQQLRKHVPM